MEIFTPNAKPNDQTMVMIILGWVVLAVLFWAAQPMPIIPSPVEVAKAFAKQWNDGLFFELATSLRTSVEAIVVATVVGLGLSYSGVIPILRPAIAFIAKLRFLSMTGMLIIFVLLAPGAHLLKVMLLVFAMVVNMVHGMTATIDAIPDSRYDHARTLGLSEWMVTREVVIRGTMAEAFETLRMNAAIAWMLLTMVEGLSRSEGGVGVLLLNLNRSMSLDAIFGIQIIILILGVFQDSIIRLIKRAVCPYAKG